MRGHAAAVAEFWERGFVLIRGVFGRDMIDPAQRALKKIYPSAARYFNNPMEFAHLTKTKFSGISYYPFPDWALNRLPVHAPLVSILESILETGQIDCYKVELWAKYAGTVDYAQPHHRDYENHSLVVPREDHLMPQITCFLFLSDVTEHDAPTKLVPVSVTKDIPLGVARVPMGELFDDEVAAVGPAGSVLFYRTDVFHRASNFSTPGRSRFTMLMDYKCRGCAWQGKMAWPDRALSPGWVESIVRMSPRERDLFGWPPIGSIYWNNQTLEDVAKRYPGIDLSAYKT